MWPYCIESFAGIVVCHFAFDSSEAHELEKKATVPLFLNPIFWDSFDKLTTVCEIFKRDF
jgi:hypothetical protein